MADNKNSFFDEDEDEEIKEPKEEPKGEKKEPKSEEKPTEDKTDWKAKYEEAEKEKLDRSYYEELLDFDDALEGDSLEAVSFGKRYRELRNLGLSKEEAYGAVSSVEASTERKTSGNKSHVNSPTFRAAVPRSRMDRATREMMEDLLPDLSEEERENLFRKVKG